MGARKLGVGSKSPHARLFFCRRLRRRGPNNNISRRKETRADIIAMASGNAVMRQAFL